MGVIFQRRAAFDEALSGAHQPGDLQLRGHGFDQKQRMGGCVAQHIAGADEAGIDPPAGTGIFLFHRLGVKTVGKLHINDTDIAQQPVGDHLPGLQDQLVAGIAVGHPDNLAPPLAERHQLVSFLAAEAQRLFAHHVQPGLQRGPADGIVGVIWRGN